MIGHHAACIRAIGYIPIDSHTKARILSSVWSSRCSLFSQARNEVGQSRTPALSRALPAQWKQLTQQGYINPSTAARREEALCSPVSFSRGPAKELQSGIARDAATTVEGMLFSLDDKSRVAGQVVARPGAGFTPLDSWRVVRMSPALARLFKWELVKVQDRSQNVAVAGGLV